MLPGNVPHLLWNMCRHWLFSSKVFDQYYISHLGEHSWSTTVATRRPQKQLIIWRSSTWMLWIVEASIHDDVIKWKHFPRYWPFVREIHRSPVNFPYKGQWRGALMFSLICARINGWINNREASDLRSYRAHYDVTVMLCGHLYQVRQKHSKQR